MLMTAYKQLRTITRDESFCLKYFISMRCFLFTVNVHLTAMHANPSSSLC